MQATKQAQAGYKSIEDIISDDGIEAARMIYIGRRQAEERHRKNSNYCEELRNNVDLDELPN